MCTAIHLEKEGVFGRTLDFERGFGESLIITPREHMKIGEAKNRYAIIGTGVEREGSALYFDGMNEWGLCGAALNFEGYAFYHGIDGKKTGLPSALLLSFMLGFCKEINEIKDTMKKLGITADSVFGFPATPLHWIFADRMGTIVIESTRDSVRVFDNPFGVLTNAPELDYHLTKASDYMSLHPGDLENKLSKAPLPKYSRGMGAIGLPGDFSSSSRFVRALFLRQNTLSYGNSIHKMMHMLNNLSVPLGCVLTEIGAPVSTRYKCAMDMESLTYYYTTYDDLELKSLVLHPEDKDLVHLALYTEKGLS